MKRNDFVLELVASTIIFQNLNIANACKCLVLDWSIRTTMSCNLSIIVSLGERIRERERPRRMNNNCYESRVLSNIRLTYEFRHQERIKKYTFPAKWNQMWHSGFWSWSGESKRGSIGNWKTDWELNRICLKNARVGVGFGYRPCSERLDWESRVSARRTTQFCY